jgi:hypothetical protein
VIHFVLENLLLLPFLLGTYLVLEMIERKSGGALESFFSRSRSFGPLIGASAGIIPQCGVSAAAASLFSAGVISIGTLLAVFFSTSDEMLPVLISNKIPFWVVGRIVALKFSFALVVGFVIDFILKSLKLSRRDVSVGELCQSSHCGCSCHHGVVRPALIHTFEVFFFILIIAGGIKLLLHFFGTHFFDTMKVSIPFVGELVSAAFGLVPNCAVSVVSTQLFVEGMISPGVLMANSFTSSGVGLLVLFRTNRSLKENFVILAVVYFLGAFLGFMSGLFF